MSQQRLDNRSLGDAIQEAHLILESAIAEHKPTAVCGLFSGGNDSTVMMYAVGQYLSHAVHINTGIGLEGTHRFVREVCELNGWLLIEEYPPDKTYEQMVRDQGEFPIGPTHLYAYSWLKERALRKVRKRFVKERGQRVMFVTGVRVHESRRRMGTAKEVDRVGSVVWVAPLLHFTQDEMRAFRKANPHIPRNEVSDILHMSGECLCGAFAKPGEREFLIEWFGDDPAIKKILQLEQELGCKWGQDFRRPRSGGRLCSSCVGQEELAI